MISLRTSDISTLIAWLITIGVIVKIAWNKSVPIITFLTFALLMDAPPKSIAATLGKAKNCGAL